MEQQIGFCTTSDGVTIAHATLGDGPPLVYVTGWPGHLAAEWEKSFSRQFLETLAEGVTLVRYDMRGSGLSDREVSDVSLGVMLKDLEAVVDSLSLDSFALLSLGFLAGPVALSSAAAHPGRVSHLIVSSGYLRGNELTTPERAKALVDYIRTFGFPLSIDAGMSKEDFEKFQDVRHIQTEAASLEVQASLAKEMLSVDVSDAVDGLTMPVLVMHGRHDQVIPFRLGRDLAARIPHAEFVPLEEPAAAPWQQQRALAREIHRFLGSGVTSGEQTAAPVTGAPLTILFTDIERSTALTQQLGDAKAQDLVRSHDAIVREAVAATEGTEVKHTGDGIMASFPSASRAIECAVAIQRGVAERTAQEPDWPLRVRIGLNAGEPVAEDSDLFGTAVQLARRVCDKAEPGQILASNVVRELAAGKGFLFSDHGESELRGFEDPVRLFDVSWQRE